MTRNPNKPSSIHPVGLLAVIIAAASLCGTASAKVIFAQTGSESSTGNGGSASDVDSGFQIADDVTLATAATVRSVKWWGLYGPFEQTPVAPFSFQLIFYGDSGGLPDPNWTAEWWVGLRSLRKFTFTTNPAINYIGIAREDGVAVNFEAISLTVENGDITPAVVSFSPAGGNTWELELLANPGAPFELRSSTNLDFSPGTLIKNLTQGNPGPDPGTISGPNNEILTTDANGAAKVRFTLTGHPRDFVRAVALP